MFLYLKDCGDLKDPDYGYCKTSGRHSGSSATYSCKDGYELYGGDHIRKCQDDGYWSGKEPRCRRCKPQEVELILIASSYNDICLLLQKTAAIQKIQSMVIARPQEDILDPQLLIPARMAMSCMEEITYENAKMMDTGLEKSHVAGDVSHKE